jgi:hypothetical protein
MLARAINALQRRATVLRGSTANFDYQKKRPFQGGTRKEKSGRGTPAVEAQFLTKVMISETV